MNRRAFLGWLAGTAAGVAAAPYLDVEKLLWVAGEKKIFIPAPKTLWTPVSLQRGDIFTIEGIYVVNPTTGMRLKYPQHFIITADVSAGDVPFGKIHPRLEDVAQTVRQGKIRPVLYGDSLGSWSV